MIFSPVHQSSPVIVDYLLEVGKKINFGENQFILSHLATSGLLH